MIDQCALSISKSNFCAGGHGIVFGRLEGERLRRRTVFLQMLAFLKGFRQCGHHRRVALLIAAVVEIMGERIHRKPPAHGKGRFDISREPFALAFQIHGVTRLVGKMPHRRDVPPQGQLGHEQGIVAEEGHGVALRHGDAVVIERPHKARRRPGNGIDGIEGETKLGHAGMIEGRSKARVVHVCQQVGMLLLLLKTASTPGKGHGGAGNRLVLSSQKRRGSSENFLLLLGKNFASSPARMDETPLAPWKQCLRAVT